MKVVRVMIVLMSVGLAFASRADQPPAPAAGATTDDAAVERIRLNGANGFRPEKTKAGTTTYCKNDTISGSRFATKQCRSFESLRDEALKGK